MGDEEDAALFRALVGDVKPLADQNRILLKQPVIHARARRTGTTNPVADTLSDNQDGDAPEEYRRNGLSRLALRSLKRCRIQDNLDLHGNTVEAARVLLQQFLSEASLRQLRCVRVIHGKGINSRGNEAVLRTHTRHWLTQHPEVLAFCPAPASEGGSGAVLILLKART